MAILLPLLVIAGLAPGPAFSQSSDQQFAAQLVQGAAEIKEAAKPAAEDTEKERLEARFAKLIDDHRRTLPAGRDKALEELGKGVTGLAKEFPRFAEDLYKIVFAIARDASDLDKKRAFAQQVAADAPTAALKKDAADFIKELDDLQRPLQIQFTATNGAAIDVSSMTGKVVLLDFWATWCGPCVAGLPEVIKTYQALHPKGFEIVGISFDKDRAKLDALVKTLGIPWAQYFDGLGWQNKYGVQYGIQGIPTLWLVDKKGRLRHIDARDGLEAKVTALLSEP